jgi:hypothetical protein
MRFARARAWRMTGKIEDTHGARHLTSSRRRSTARFFPQVHDRLAMTQQNRVDAWGSLHAVSARGGLMGNRGILHESSGRIFRNWASQCWVTCLLEFGGRSSPGAFRPGHYSKLFMLDEATAFAAGHRPCGECQRRRYTEFRDAWKEANVAPTDLEGFSLKALDRQLHEERLARNEPKGKRTFLSPVEQLPFGTLVECSGTAFLIRTDKTLVRWSFDGYGDSMDPPEDPVRVLTPASIVRTFASGFAPRVHPSAH